MMTQGRGASAPLYVPYRCADLPRPTIRDDQGNPWKQGECHQCHQPVWVQPRHITPDTIIECNRCMGYLK